MKVSELAAYVGVTPKAIRFYESKGVLPAAPRAENGYREYDQADICRLRIVVTLRHLGLGVDESGRLAEMCSTGRCDEMSGALVARLGERRREIATARSELDHLDLELAALERSLADGAPHPTLCLGKEDLDDDALMRLPLHA